MNFTSLVELDGNNPGGSYEKEVCVPTLVGVTDTGLPLNVSAMLLALTSRFWSVNSTKMSVAGLTPMALGRGRRVPTVSKVQFTVVVRPALSVAVIRPL